MPRLRYESEGVRGSQSVQRVTASHDESRGVGPVLDRPLPYRGRGHAMGNGKKMKGDRRVVTLPPC